jgi:hypothetical protein
MIWLLADDASSYLLKIYRRRNNEKKISKMDFGFDLGACNIFVLMPKWEFFRQ